jgi:uncharacterized Zn finger protein
MDTGEGKFVQLKSLEEEYVEAVRKKYPQAKGIFAVGEEIEIKGSLFRVKEITPFGIKLKLLK